jgi:hypothetical protein
VALIISTVAANRKIDMFARKVAARLKPNSLTEFTNLMEREILPWLRKQEGFLDLIMLVVPDGREVAAISFWDRRENAKKYHSGGYPEVLKTLDKLLEGAPHVKTFDVLTSKPQRVPILGTIVSDNSAGDPQTEDPQYETRP